MVLATLSPGQRPTLQAPADVLGTTETIPPTEAAPPKDIAATAANEDWADPGFGLDDVDLGDDSVLDDLHNRCADEDLLACDDLHFAVSGTRSPYELWGLTCGDRTDLIRGTCSEQFLDTPFDPQFDYVVGDCLVLPRSAGGLFRRVGCDRAHDAEILASLATTTAMRSLDGAFYVSADAGVQMIRTCSATIAAMAADLISAGAPDDLRGGIVAPTSASETTKFSCFVWAPGKALRKPLTTHFQNDS